MRRKWKKEQEGVPWEEFLFMRRGKNGVSLPWVFQGTDRLFVQPLPLDESVLTQSSSWNISEGKERQETLRFPVSIQVRTVVQCTAKTANREGGGPDGHQHNKEPCLGAGIELVL